MEEPHRIELPFDGPLVCELLAVVRDHHDSMVGNDRERPGMDRVRIRVANAEPMVVDLWTRSGQTISAAPRWIELRDDGDTVVWNAADAANDDAIHGRLSRVG